MEHKTYETLIKQIAAALARRANADLKRLGLTMPQADLLCALAEMPEQTASFKETEQRIRMAQSTTVSLIARLEQKGLVASFVDEEDRRAKRVRLTEEGARCVGVAAEQMRETQEHLLSGLTDVERIVFFELLKKVGGYMI